MTPDEQREWETIIPGLSDIQDAGPRNSCQYLIGLFAVMTLFWAAIIFWAVVVR